jgi:hypothetical protein
MLSEGAMADTNAYDKPLTVEVCEGEVVLSTPSGPFGISLTADAAARTAHDLATAAKLAMSRQASQGTDVRD